MSDDWEPPPGMTKRICEECDKPFASAGSAKCPDCILGRRRNDNEGKRRRYYQERGIAYVEPRRLSSQGGTT